MDRRVPVVLVTSVGARRRLCYIHTAAETEVSMRSEGAVVISGTETAAELKGSLKTQVEELQKKDPSFKPGLVIVQVNSFVIMIQ